VFPSVGTVRFILDIGECNKFNRNLLPIFLVLSVSTTTETANILAHNDTRASADFQMHKGSV